MPPRAEELEEEYACDLEILREAEHGVAGGLQPSQELWDIASKAVITGTLNSLSDIALAVYGSSSSMRSHSAETFVDDGSGPNRHIPSCVRHVPTPPSVLAVIADALPGLNIDAPACHLAAANLYGFWVCPCANCAQFVDVAHLGREQIEFLSKYPLAKDATVVFRSGIGRVVAGRPAGARAALQLLAYRHFELAHLSKRGLEMVVWDTADTTNGEYRVTWRWKATWLELMPDIQAAAEDDERRLSQVVRQWLSDKGARVCDRLRQPHWVKYRLWARRDRAERQRVVRAALDAGSCEYDAAFELFRCNRFADLEETNRSVFEAHERAEDLDRDVLNFTLLPVRPWPRDYPSWDSLSENERAEIVTAYVSADHKAQAECEHRIYNVPHLAPW